MHLYLQQTVLISARQLPLTFYFAVHLWRGEVVPFVIVTRLSLQRPLEMGICHADTEVLSIIASILCGIYA